VLVREGTFVESGKRYLSLSPMVPWWWGSNSRQDQEPRKSLGVCAGVERGQPSQHESRPVYLYHFHQARAVRTCECHDLTSWQILGRQ
jgi:hypothetical protein